MEGETSNDSLSRKRAREGEDEADNGEILIKGKKQETISMNYPDDESLCEYEFHDGIGVFDFPWLKEEEGVVFTSAFDDNNEKLFAPSSFLEDCSVAAEKLLFSPPPPPMHDPKHDSLISSSSTSAAADGKVKGGGDDGFWSLVVDDLEPLDRIWSCVIDQSLDVGFNKG